MAKNSEYWEKRVASEVWRIYNSIEEKNRELLDFYIGASESVKDELYRLAERLSKDGVLSLSEMHKQNRLAELNKKFEKIIENLGHDIEEFAKKNMQQGFQRAYKAVAVSMGDTDFAMPNKKLMEKLMETPWRGDTFSGRLWKNQKKLANVLNDVLLVGLQQGKTATEIAVQLHNRMGQSFNDCHRLVRTETMHYLNDATLQRYKDTGVEMVQIWAAQDERTCDTCGGYHAKKYLINKCPHVPLHANCRCTVLPVVDDAAKDRRKYKDSEGNFTSFDARQKKDGTAVIKPRNIMKAMKKTQIGLETLQYIEDNDISVNVWYGVDVDEDLAGLFEDGIIHIYADNTKSIKETVSTIIHETTHARINKPNTKNQELECYKNECRYLGIELTDDIVAGIMKHIDKKYPYLEWE